MGRAEGRIGNGEHHRQGHYRSDAFDLSDRSGPSDKSAQAPPAIQGQAKGLSLATPPLRCHEDFIVAAGAIV